ncbi:MAG TPA: hypothetical protein PL155_00995 [Candidatus Omnitrophota bacterium]|nr:hypothetical protein [Candidatus Omnitrophota bacterium]HPD84938.1 hypothetical protein [Candidatus Omnitrophota bacterium]HRZ03796.1 hypothetical protein [Candidatus Omnitrophota bacterium]
MSPKQKKLFWIFLSVFSLCFFLIKLQSSALTKILYQQNQFNLLNIIAHSKETQSLDFYIGAAQEAFWGPLGEIISGLLFLSFAFVYLRKSSAKVFGLVVFIYFLITRFEVLFFPPYGDAIGGPFAEAIWLARHSFDYVGLYHEPGYAFGGPKVYLFSMYPGFLALLIKIIPSVKLFLFVNHLAVFMMGAAVVALSRKIFLKVFDEEISLTASILAASVPLFLSQLEAINMEMPTLLCVIISISFLADKKVMRAAAMGLVAMLVKETGGIACGTVFVVGMTLFLFDKELKFNWRILLGSSLALGFAFIKVFVKFVAKDQHVVEGLINFLAGWPSLRWSIILILYSISLLILVGLYAKGKFQAKKGWVEAFRDFLDKRYVTFVMFVCAGMWFVLFVNFYAVSPRYRLLLVPFLIFCVLFVLNEFIRSKTIIKRVLVAVIVFMLVISYGAFYTPLKTNDHVLLERSLEYRNDLNVHIRMAKEIENNYSNYLIAAPFTVAQLLALPELGYVHKALDVMIYSMRCTYGNIKNFQGLRYLDIAKTVWVGVVTEVPRPFVYPVDPQDRILKEIISGNKKITLFMGGFAVEKMLRIRAYLQDQGMLRKSYTK